MNEQKEIPQNVIEVYRKAKFFLDLLESIEGYGFCFLGPVEKAIETVKKVEDTKKYLKFAIREIEKKYPKIRKK